MNARRGMTQHHEAINTVCAAITAGGSATCLAAWDYISIFMQIGFFVGMCISTGYILYKWHKDWKNNE